MWLQELEKFMSNRHVALDPLSTTPFKLLKGWLAECDVNHQICQFDRNTSSTFNGPSRLIKLNIRDVSTVNLQEVAQLSHCPPYVALSHCWGQGPRVLTSLENVSQHKIELRVETLPKTFKDAITVCRSTGIQYLWIDSLCIIQDDLEDWEIESEKMGYIFQNAYFTIAASSASHDTDGFLLPRHPVMQSDTNFWCCEPIDGLIIGNFQMRPDLGVDTGPLNRRAWVCMSRDSNISFPIFLCSCLAKYHIVPEPKKS